jgi:hypothetical protein
MLTYAESTFAAVMVLPLLAARESGTVCAGGAQKLLAGPPAERGSYRALLSYPGDEYYMGASKEVELVIR